MGVSTSSLVESRWDSGHAAGLDEVDTLVYASNLLGQDPRITNFGGGNTSVKTRMPDPLSGEPVDVLWVKGSGGDLGSCTRLGFASLRQRDVVNMEAVVKRRNLHEDDVVGLYPYCTFGLNPTPCSIDTPLHAFAPKKAVSHMHADAVIAIAASEDAESLCQEVWGGELGFLPWRRPGFDLGLAVRDLARDHPEAKGGLMAKHGFICWADDWAECYALTVRLINNAQEYIDRKGRTQPFGGSVVRSEAFDLQDILPRIRGGSAWEGRRVVCHLNTNGDALEFLASQRGRELASRGTSCPDHFLRTKVAPLWLEPGDDLESRLGEFRAGYASYYDRCVRGDSPAMRNPNPSVVLLPGAGILGMGKSPREARVTTEFFCNAIRVMYGAERVSSYTSLPELEAFNIEYWLLEEAKLKRQPPESELARRVAVVTGAAQGIGLATSKRLASLGACVTLVDRDAGRLDAALKSVRECSEAGAVLGAAADVTNVAELDAAFASTVLEFGGLDVLVVNAGTARRGAVAETSDEDYRVLSNVLMKGYFDTIAAGIRVMRRQGTGGSIVVVGSKNGVAVGSNAALYSAAKAFELHLMRATAVDYAVDGIRCNAVNPDAVVVGSGIWDDAWREQTASALGIAPGAIEEHYRNRTMLKREVLPEHVAEAVTWLASEARSSRTTGCVITVDSGNREGFLR